MDRKLLFCFLILFAGAQAGGKTQGPSQSPEKIEEEQKIKRFIQSDTSPSPDTIRGHLANEPVSLDPALADDDYSLKILSNTMDGLMGYDGDGHLENRLAKSFKISEGGRRYTFTLRPGALWSDGKPITARDFVTGLQRTLDPKTNSKLSNLLFIIKGARDVYSGKLKPDQLGVQSERGRLTINLERSAPHILHVLTIPQAAPLREDILRKNSGKWPETGPTTGAYQIIFHHRDESIRLEPNNKYWNYKPSTRAIDLKIIADDSTSVSLFESGNLDFISRIPGADLARLRKRGDIVEFPHASTYFLSFNTHKAPFNDIEFRRAVAGSIKREEIISILQTGQIPAYVWVPPPLEGYEKIQGSNAFLKSVDSVKKTLALNPIPVKAVFNSNDMNSKIMQKIQFDLKTLLGMNIELRGMDWKSYVDLIRSDTPQLYRFGRGAPFLDPIWHLLSFTGGDSNNPTGWKSVQYDRLVEEISSLSPGTQRLNKIKKAQHILCDEEAVVIPLFYNNQIFAVSPRIRGFKSNPMGVTLFSEISFNK